MENIESIKKLYINRRQRLYDKQCILIENRKNNNLKKNIKRIDEDVAILKKILINLK